MEHSLPVESLDDAARLVLHGRTYVVESAFVFRLLGKLVDELGPKSGQLQRLLTELHVFKDRGQRDASDYTLIHQLLGSLIAFLLPVDQPLSRSRVRC